MVAAPTTRHVRALSERLRVANVRDFSGRLEAAPAWIASARGGEGFSEIAGVILSARAAARRGERNP